MTVHVHLTAVAFLQSVGGRVGVLLTIDVDGAWLYEGEPALMVQHRPGDEPSQMQIEGADIVPVAFVEAMRVAATDLAAVIDGSYGRDGQFQGERLVGSVVEVQVPTGLV